jgi:hypothetical protein
MGIRRLRRRCVKGLGFQIERVRRDIPGHGPQRGRSKAVGAAIPSVRAVG